MRKRELRLGVYLDDRREYAPCDRPTSLRMLSTFALHAARTSLQNTTTREEKAREIRYTLVNA